MIFIFIINEKFEIALEKKSIRMVNFQTYKREKTLKNIYENEFLEQESQIVPSSNGVEPPTRCRSIIWLYKSQGEIARGSVNR